MNIDGRNFANINDSNHINTNASVQGNSVEFVKGTEAFFDDETQIQRAETTGDAYDRIVHEVDTGRKGDMAATSETIRELTEVVMPENYSKYEELGIEPDKDEPSHILTVSERIEIELAVHCEGYTPIGDIDISDLEKMYGDTGATYGVRGRIEEGEGYISRDMTEYLLVNQLPLTEENIYKAQYSVSGTADRGYEKLSDTQWEELKPQIEKMLDSSGMDTSDRNLENGRWLVERKIPVTVENLYQMSRIDDINGGGTGYDKTSVTAMEAREIIENGTEEQITTLITDGKEVTLLNMKRVEEDSTRKAQAERKERENPVTERQQRQIQMSKKNLEELRLKMTVEASVMMMKKGIYLEIMPLSQLVDELKEMDTVYAGEVFQAAGYVADTEQIEQFLDTTEIMKQFAATPSYVMGTVLKEDINFQIADMTQEGGRIERELREAEKVYDTLGTKPDRELGDSLNKAFGNIDNILKESGEDVTADNQRAVRILAYNQMEITGENIRTVREMDMQVTRLIDNLTPRTTVYLIANGVNPLKTNISELNEELDNLNEEIGVDSVERYSEFLWKLDKNQAIDKEDREAYIGIYRLINMIEKGDRRAIGAVVKQGGEMTMRNLLTAARSLKHTGQEISVDDTFGVQEDIRLADSNIDNQLMQWERSAFLKRAKDVISPVHIKNTMSGIQDGLDVPLQEFVEKMTQEYRYEQEEEAAYNRLRCGELQQLQTISEEVFLNIAEDGMPENMENLLGISYYILNRGRTFTKIQSICDEEEVDRDIAELEDMEDGDEDAQVLSDKLKQLNEDIQNALLDKSQINVEDVRMVSRMADYIARASDKGTYYVPAEIQGRKTTIKVTLYRGTEEKGKLDVTIHREKEDIQAQMDIRHGEVQVLLSAEEEDLRQLQNIEVMFQGKLADKNISLKSFAVMRESMPIREKEESGVSDGELFTVAKVWIACVKNCLGQTDN